MDEDETFRRLKRRPFDVVQHEARARVAQSQKPTLRDLFARFGGWDVAEVSGKDDSIRTKKPAQES